MNNIDEGDWFQSPKILSSQSIFGHKPLFCSKKVMVKDGMKFSLLQSRLVQTLNLDELSNILLKDDLAIPSYPHETLP